MTAPVGAILTWRSLNGMVEGVVEEGEIVRLKNGHTFRLCDLSEKSTTIKE